MEDREIIKKLTSIETKLDLMRGDYMKLLFALLAVIAASIGLKFVGSPAWVDLSTYAAFFASAFVLVHTCFRWKIMNWKAKAVRLAIVGFIMFSTICRTFIFNARSEIPPIWYTPIIDGFFIVICVLLVVRIWRDN